MAYITALNVNLFLGSLHRASHFVPHILCVTRNTNEAASLCGGEWGGYLLMLYMKTKNSLGNFDNYPANDVLHKSNKNKIHVNQILRQCPCS